MLNVFKRKNNWTILKAFPYVKIKVRLVLYIELKSFLASFHEIKIISRFN